MFIVHSKSSSKIFIGIDMHSLYILYVYAKICSKIKEILQTSKAPTEIIKKAAAIFLQCTVGEGNMI